MEHFVLLIPKCKEAKILEAWVALQSLMKVTEGTEIFPKHGWLIVYMQMSINQQTSFLICVSNMCPTSAAS